MQWLATISVISWLCFAIFAFVAVMNGWALYQNNRHQTTISYVPFVGLIFFWFATLGWQEPLYLWLLTLLDIGTITVLLGLPFLLKEIFSQSCFTHYQTYFNNEQKLTLYKHGQSQSFRWQWLSKSPVTVVADNQPFTIGFGGDWMIENQHLILTKNDEVIAKATLNTDSLSFDDKVIPPAKSLANAIFYLKHSKKRI